MITPQNVLDHHVLLVLKDGNEDKWGRLLRLAKSNDDHSEGAHVFRRDIGSINPLKNMTFLNSVFYNLLNSETLLICICMCLYAYVSFKQICKGIII